MNKRKIENKEELILLIQNALNKSEDAKYYHRLDLVMLAVSGMAIKEIAALYNESPTTISYWTKKVVENGIDSLKSGTHPGRPSRLTEEQLQQLDQDLQKSPSDFGYDVNLWDGNVLSKHLEDHYFVTIQVRQCQRIIRRLGYTLQHPQTTPHGGSKEEQEGF
jgi:transposase